MTLGSFAFFLNRYLSILGQIPVLLEFYGFALSPVSPSLQELKKGTVALIITFC